MIRTILYLVGGGILIGFVVGAFIVDLFQNLETVLP